MGKVLSWTPTLLNGELVPGHLALTAPRREDKPFEQHNRSSTQPSSHSYFCVLGPRVAPPACSGTAILQKPPVRSGVTSCRLPGPPGSRFGP